MNEPIWTLGFLVGFPLVTLIAAVLLGVGGWLLVRYSEALREQPANFDAHVANHERHTAYFAEADGDKDYWERSREYDTAFGLGASDTDQHARSRGSFAPEKESLGVGLVAVIAGVLVTVLTGFALWPWQPQYHQYRVVQGTVQGAAGVRLDTDGNARLYREFQLRINGHDYVCGSAQCSDLKPGDTVKLRCLANYHRAGAPTQECSYVSRKSA